MISTYILTGKRLDGHITMQYTNGVLNAVKMALKGPLNDSQFAAFKKLVPQHESEIGDLKLIGLHVAKEAASNEKIELFCRVYERHKGIKYKVTPREAGQVKLVNFDEQLLEKYFTSDNFIFKAKHSIGNLVRYYNELRAEIAALSKPKYPDYFDKTYQAKLPTEEHKFYWSHLRSLGLEAMRDRNGAVIDWVKKI